MTTKAQLYLNEQTTEREFVEKLAAKDAEIAELQAKVKQLRVRTVLLGIHITHTMVFFAVIVLATLWLIHVWSV